MEAVLPCRGWATSGPRTPDTLPHPAPADPNGVHLRHEEGSPDEDGHPARRVVGGSLSERLPEVSAVAGGGYVPAGAMSAAVVAPQGAGRMQFGVAWRGEPVSLGAPGDGAAATAAAASVVGRAQAHAAAGDDSRPSRRRARPRQDLDGSSESGGAAEASWTSFDGEAFFDAQ